MPGRVDEMPADPRKYATRQRKIRYLCPCVKVYIQKTENVCVRSLCTSISPVSARWWYRCSHSNIWLQSKIWKSPLRSQQRSPLRVSLKINHRHLNKDKYISSSNYLFFKFAKPVRQKDRQNIPEKKKIIHQNKSSRRTRLQVEKTSPHSTRKMKYDNVGEKNDKLMIIYTEI